MEIKEALNEIENYARQIVTMEHGKEICTAFGKELPEKAILKKGWTKRIRAYGDDSVDSVDISNLATWLSETITGKRPKPSSYLGAGRIAEHWSLESVKLLRLHYKIFRKSDEK